MNFYFSSSEIEKATHYFQNIYFPLSVGVFLYVGISHMSSMSMETQEGIRSHRTRVTTWVQGHNTEFSGEVVSTLSAEPTLWQYTNTFENKEQPTHQSPEIFTATSTY